jgi:dienelactone hydrolase
VPPPLWPPDNRQLQSRAPHTETGATGSQRRGRTIAAGAVVALTIAVVLIVALNGGRSTPGAVNSSGTHSAAVSARHPRPTTSFAVGLRVLRFTDASRLIRLPDGTTEPRSLLTYIRYPARGNPRLTDRSNAPAAGGRFPLVVFGHGFAKTPDLYKRLLRAWARAGYVVAAPVFPLENANAPGGPNESDLINQPADMRFVISRMLAASAAPAGPLHGLVDPARIAVSGQSDGGDTALALAYNSRLRDPRVRAAIVLSGAELPGLGGFDFPAETPPLLATQGTADTINPPSLTSEFFDSARPPKYLLSLLAAEHLGPYSDQQPQLAIVQRGTISFLDAYLRHSARALKRLSSLGDVPAVASLLANP